jgi:hypothetical protein
MRNVDGRARQGDRMVCLEIEIRNLLKLLP